MNALKKLAHPAEARQTSHREPLESDTTTHHKQHRGVAPIPGTPVSAAPPTHQPMPDQPLPPTSNTTATTTTAAHDPGSHPHQHHAGRDAALAGGAAGVAAHEHHKHEAEHAGGHHHQGGVLGHKRGVSNATASTGSARSSAEFADPARATAEAGNNFPGTNPNSAHSALGVGKKGAVFPGTS